MHANAVTRLRYCMLVAMRLVEDGMRQRVTPSEELSAKLKGGNELTNYHHV